MEKRERERERCRERDDGWHGIPDYRPPARRLLFRILRLISSLRIQAVSESFALASHRELVVGLSEQEKGFPGEVGRPSAISIGDNDESAGGGGFR